MSTLECTSRVTFNVLTSSTHGYVSASIQRCIQPLEKMVIVEQQSSELTMLFSSIICGKAHKGLRTSQCVIEHLGLPVKEMIAVCFARQRGTCDLVCDSLQRPRLRRINQVPDRVNLKRKQTIFDGPAYAGVALHHLLKSIFRYPAPEQSGYPSRRAFSLKRYVHTPSSAINAANADSHKCNSSGVHLGPSQQIIHNRCHNLFPIWTEREMLFTNERALARSFKCQAVIASLNGCRSYQKIQFFSSRIVTAVNEKGRTRLWGIVWSVEITWKRRSVVGNQNLFHGSVHQFNRFAEGSSALSPSVQNPGILRIAV